jgi:hypothetical protein
MERILSRVKTQRHGLALDQMEYKERIATDADIMWRTGMMAAHGIFVPNRNIDKENRR